MKRFATMLAVLGLTASTTFGAAIFDPPVIEVDINDIPETVQTALIVSYSGDAFNNVSVVIGSDELTMMGFDYSQDFIDGVAFPPADPAPLGFYPSDLFIGGFLSAVRTGEYLLGTLTIGLPSTAGGFSVGQEFLFEINPEIDFGFSTIGAANTEPLSGSGIVRVVPEPATLMLLGLGAVGLVRRRFA